MIYCKYPSSSLTIYSHFYRKLNLFIKFPSCTYPGCYIVYPKVKKKIIKYYCYSKYFKRSAQKKKKTFFEFCLSFDLVSRLRHRAGSFTNITKNNVKNADKVIKHSSPTVIGIDSEYILHNVCFWTW